MSRRRHAPYGRVHNGPPVVLSTLSIVFLGGHLVEIFEPHGLWALTISQQAWVPQDGERVARSGATQSPCSVGKDY